MVLSGDHQARVGYRRPHPDEGLDHRLQPLVASEFAERQNPERPHPPAEVRRHGRESQNAVPAHVDIGRAVALLQVARDGHVVVRRPELLRPADAHVHAHQAADDHQ